MADGGTTSSVGGLLSRATSSGLKASAASDVFVFSSSEISIGVFMLVVLALSAFALGFGRGRKAPPSTPAALPAAAAAEPKSTQSDLLGSREFVRDMARLAEQIIMYDVPNDFFTFDCSQPDSAKRLRLALKCREQPAFFAPDKVGELAEKSDADKESCQVRWKRALWTIAFKKRYRPVVVDWVDTGRDNEKQALVMLLTPTEGAASTEPPIITVAFRGSKTFADYAVTDINPMMLPLPTGELSDSLMLPQTASVDAELSQARFCMLYANSRHPCVHLGCWKAYAGEAAHATLEGDAPRARVRRAVEQLIQRHPTARIVVTGHSLGGALSTLCAYDLLAHSPAVRALAQPLTLVNYAAPRMFNQAFQDAMTALVDGRRLDALRVVVGADIIARIPPKQLGAAHGVRARLLLNPEDQAAPARYDEDDIDDSELWRILPRPDHSCHALYLGGDTTPGHPLTLPKTFPWPLKRAARPTETVSGSRRSRSPSGRSK